MPRPTLSLCVICGDDHIDLLPRLIESFTKRPSGVPACDEIVIGWNGEKHSEFTNSLLISRESSKIPIKQFYSPWTGNFAAARQESFERAEGEWRMYADCDDILATPDNSLLGQIPEAKISFSGTLQDRLRSLPDYINCVEAPYFYVISDKNQPVKVTRRPRIVRWDSFWAWTDDVHETLRHALGREFSIFDSGILLVHSPTLTAEVRSERNYEIIRKQVAAFEAKQIPMPENLCYGLACELMDRGEFTEASERFQAAALTSTSTPESRLFYSCLASKCELRGRNIQGAVAMAMEAIKAAPHRPEGYLAASEAAFESRLYEYAAHWYEASLDKEIPKDTMVSDQIENVIRPVYYAGATYLRLSKFEEALAVAERTLAKTQDPFALKVQKTAKAGIHRIKMVKAIAEALGEVSTSGFAGNAFRCLSELGPILKSEERQGIWDRIDAEGRKRQPQELPQEIQRWFASQGSENTVSVAVPVDSVDSPADLIDAAAAQASERLFVAATDTEDLTEYTAGVRREAVSATSLLDACEKHGAVNHLSLVDEGEARFIVAQVTKRKSVAPWSPDVTFWAPVCAEPWGPWRLLRFGTGGSEEAVIYLAQELAKRGVKTQVFAPLDTSCHRGVHIENDIRWYPLEALSMVTPMRGKTISCRAPGAVRVPCFDPTPAKLAVWHQDAQYHQGQWSGVLAKAVTNFFVSDWQKKLLLHSVGLSGSDLGIVCGDGIPESVLEWDGAQPRDPAECVYISSPTRGLEQLLEIWPSILQAHPDAKLHAYYGWETAPVHAYPEVKQARDRIMSLIGKTDRVIWHDRVPQLDLEADLKTKGVWLYPCVFPEGFCIAGVRATGAGLIPVYRQVAAMPEVQYPSQFAVSGRPWEKSGREEFLAQAIKAIDLSKTAGSLSLRETQREWAKKHLWSTVADRMIDWLGA